MSKFKLNLVGAFLLIMLAVPVYAQTVEYGYSLYLNESLTTHEATKAGGNSFENNFYVTQVSTVRPSDSTRYFSYHARKNGKQVSNGLKLAEDDFKRHFNSYYSGKAVANTKYKLYCKCTGYGTESDKAIVTGRWTP